MLENMETKKRDDTATEVANIFRVSGSYGLYGYQHRSHSVQCSMALGDMNG